uniref:Retrotransposon protein, putative, unclassified n=1 Tax=Oryza sativa subsp. japonica TaxID=39947 RepID=Q33A43_ORYSJ|nr:retrotransposon protein, putative, unclassified [Oryza sativa Japonica Group]
MGTRGSAAGVGEPVCWCRRQRRRRGAGAGARQMEDVMSRLPLGQARLHLIAFIGHRLPSQTNTYLLCTLCPHSCAPGKNFPVGHLSQIAPGQARLTLEFFGDWLPEKKLEKKLQLVDMSILLILLSPRPGCYTLTPLREIDAPVDQP